MSKEEKLKDYLFVCAMRSIEGIDKTLTRLRKAEEKVSYESPEYRIIGNAIVSLIEAENHLRILADRNIKKPSI